jgi:hypothetical protein
MLRKLRCRRRVLAIVLSLCALLGGCSDPATQIKSDSALSEKLRRAERVAVELYADEHDQPELLDRQTIDRLADAMSDAVAHRNTLTWEVTGRLTVTIEGKSEEWLLGLHPESEGRVRVSGSEYYRGLDSARVLSALAGDQP